MGCVSESQFKVLKNYLSKGGAAWLALPFGTHDERGFKRETPLSAELLKHNYKNLVVVDTATKGDPLRQLISKGTFQPVIKQLAGDTRWAVRIRIHQDKPVIHFMNTAMIAIPHPVLKDVPGIPVLNDIGSKIEDNNLTYEINTNRVKLTQLALMSPELGEKVSAVDIRKVKERISTINVNLTGVKVYAIVQ
jgi:hypothetical protein